jgi:acyl dehydratase
VDPTTVRMAEDQSMTEHHAVPLDQRTLDYYVPGLVETHGPLEVTEAEIVAFASSFDPHDMHVDPEAARRGQFGGLIASGWHTTAMMMRLVVGGFLNQRASVASPGVDELRWLLPVRPGDQLSARFTVLSSRASVSKPDRGLVRTRIELLNQRDEVVMSQVMMNLILRELPAPA